MFHDSVEGRPEFLGYEGLGSSEYSGREDVLPPFSLAGDAGYWLLGDLDRPPVHPAAEALPGGLPRLAQYCADEAWEFVASQRRDETLIVDELDNFSLGL